MKATGNEILLTLDPTLARETRLAIAMVVKP